MFSIGDFAKLGRDTEDVIVKHIPAVRVAELTATAASYEGADIGPVIQPLYPELFRRLEAAGVAASGPPIAYHEPVGDGPDGSDEAVTVHAAVVVNADHRPDHDFAIVELPEIRSAATIVHRGSMDEADRSMQILARWVEDNGRQVKGYAREVCLEFVPDDPGKWVHEFQVAVTGS